MTREDFMKIACKVFDAITIENDDDGGELTAICNALVTAYNQGIEDSAQFVDGVDDGVTSQALRAKKIGSGGQGED